MKTYLIWAVRTLPAAMCLVTLILMLSKHRLMLGGVLFCAILAISRLQIVKKCFVLCREYFDARPWMALGIVLLCGLILRALIFSAVPWMFPIAYSHNPADYAYLDYCAQHLVAEQWIHSKSWVTVCYYAAWYQVFGVSARTAIVASITCYAITSAFLFAIVRRFAGCFVAAISAFVFFTCPLVILQEHWVATENLFSLFVLASLWCLMKVLKAERLLVSVAWIILCGICIWGANLSRGEGIILWGVIPATLFVVCIAYQRRGRAFACAMVTLVVLYLLGAFVVREVNFHTIGRKVFSGTYTVYLNKVFGSNYEEHGRWNKTDIQFLWSEYCKSYPDCRGGNWWNFRRNNDDPLSMKCLFFLDQFPMELAPVADQIVADRWQGMSFLKKIFHMSVKQNVWKNCWDPTFVGPSMGFPFRVIWYSQAGWYGLLLIMLTWTLWRYRNRLRFSLFALPFFLLVLGQVCVLCVTETMERYTWIGLFYLSSLAPLCLSQKGVTNE